MKKILIIDDDPDFVQMMTIKFNMEGYEVHSAPSGLEGIKIAYKSHPDIIILDIMMPETDGFETCKQLRRMTNTPILILTARSAESDVIRGLYQGADDFLSKPFSYEVLDAHIGALLRRAECSQQQSPKPDHYSDEKFSINLESQYLASFDKKEKLTQTECEILTLLLGNNGTPTSYQALSMKLWGRYDQSSKDSLAVHIASLRKKMRSLCVDHEYIQNQWGIGYFFSTRKT